MGIPTARPMIMPILLLSSEVVSTPLATTLEEPTESPATVEPEVRVEERADEEDEVEDELPVGVVPVPVTTTEPSWMLVKVIRSTRVGSAFMPVSSQVTSSSMRLSTTAVELALRVKLKPMFMLL